MKRAPRAIKEAPSCQKCGAGGTAQAPDHAPIIALIGAPNAGKSTLFNALTGAKAQMGNWPGTTVEVSRGAWRTPETTYDVIDFPGTYSLTAVSPDEYLTREMLLERAPEERPDLVIVVADASQLARSLYLAAEIAEEPYRVVLALTKSDIAAKREVSVNPQALEAALGIPVVAVDPRRKSNIAAVAETVARAMRRTPTRISPLDPALPDEERLDARFELIDQAVAASIGTEGGNSSFSDRIDRFVLHPLLGSLIFLVAMWLVFQITTTVAAPLQDGLESFITGTISDVVSSWLPDIPLIQGLIVNGLISGVGMVLTFAPLMALMFLCLAILEDSGYMARAAVVSDRLMRSIGLPGKAFIPLIVGFGCNVPAISATRVLGNPRHRILTALLIPFTSCSARLTVYVMLASTFFPDHAGSVVFLMYLISIGLIVLTGLALRHTLWRTMPSEPLVIDLPEYQLPVPRLVFSVMWQRLRGFLQTAGGIIVVTVTLVWLLQSTPVASNHSWGDEDLPPQDSAYGVISDGISPIFEPAGFGSWSLSGTLITGFVAKEAVISTWAQTYAVDDVTDDDADTQASSPLAQNIRQDFAEASGGHTIPAVWAFMIFLLAYTPCVATLAAQKREIGLKWTLFGLLIQLGGAWALSVLTFQLLKLFL
ncbi:ferrous iron transport protein B [Corynebacterium poyangense]|uniref:Ferrous iron transport protein B n=1 Tax=Corynebacterium poyangense TaxID=2684405 RepID=A0A7H0SL37_9CORY|nr:ferrous iron transport protein B [Corynebacterium poyangense]QNQ89262.1 ferrous iron transport protein B [Corynebacterium poyangense]